MWELGTMFQPYNGNPMVPKSVWTIGHFHSATKWADPHIWIFWVPNKLGGFPAMKIQLAGQPGFSVDTRSQLWGYDSRLNPKSVTGIQELPSVMS